VLYEKYESQARVAAKHLTPAVAVKSFREVAQPMTSAEIHAESSRCLECGCRGADTCKLRAAGDAFVPDVKRFAFGAVRERYVDDSHPRFVSNPKKCITAATACAFASRTRNAMR
jgi:formate dehydrogenase major subunit